MFDFEDIQRRIEARLNVQKAAAKRNKIDFYDLNPYEVAEELLGRSGAMLSGSKSAPAEDRVVWNANVLANKMKIWHGDISITRKEKELQTLANDLGVKIYVLREMDARFDTEANPRIKDAVATFEPKES